MSTRVEIAFEKFPGAPRNQGPITAATYRPRQELRQDCWWSDITGYVKSFSTKRGRSYEMDRVETGTANVVLDNADGRFTPGRVASPYYPYVRPRRGIRIIKQVGVNLLHPDLATGGDYGASDFLGGEVASPSFAALANAQLYMGSQELDWRYYATGGRFGNGYLTYQESTKSFPGGGTEFSNGFPYALSDFIPVSSGPDGITFSAYVRNGHDVSSNTFTVRPFIDLYRRGAGAAPENMARVTGSATALAYSSDWSSSSAAWVRVSVTVPAAHANWANTTAVRIGFINASPAATGRINIAHDAMQLEYGQTATTHDPTSGAFPVFTGEVERWPVQFSDGPISEVSVPCSDLFSTLGRKVMTTRLREAFLVGKPSHYWPLTDGADATTSGSLCSDEVATKKISKYGGTAAFGGPSIAYNDGSASGSFAVSGSDGSLGGAMTMLMDAGASLGYIGPGQDYQDWSFVCAYERNNSSQSVNFQIVSIWNTAGVKVFSAWVTPAGELKYQWDTGMGTTYTNTVAGDPIPANTPQSFGVSVAKHSFNALGLANGLSINGSIELVESSTKAHRIAYVQVGGNTERFQTGSNADGKVSHVAMWLDGSPGSTTGIPPAVTFRWATDFARLSMLTSQSVEAPVEGALLSAGLKTRDWSGEVSDGTAIGTSAGNLQDGSALAMIQDVENMAQATAFIRTDGLFVWRSRRNYVNAASKLTLATSLGTGVEPGLLFEVDDDRVVNEIQVNDPDGAAVRVANEASASEYGPRGESFDFDYANESEARNFANWRVNRLKDPQTRCDQVVLRASASATLLNQVIGLELTNKITLAELPSTAPYTSAEFMIEGINCDVRVDGETEDWTITYQLSPAEWLTFWVLEDPVYGVIDSDNRIMW